MPLLAIPRKRKVMLYVVRKSYTLPAATPFLLSFR